MNFIHLSRVLCICTILFMFVTNSNTAVYRVKNSEDPDHPGLCHFNDELSPEENKTSMFIKPGETKKHPNECQQIYCQEDFALEINGCGLAEGTGECSFVVGNNTDTYPECCGQIICGQAI